MNLREFRLLDTPEGDQDAARMSWIAYMILGQHGRLRRGENMAGPCDMFQNGRRHPLGEIVSSVSIELTTDQLDGHPWVDLNVTNENWLHLLSVELISPFDSFMPGDLIDVVSDSTSLNPQRLQVPLTQQMIDGTTKVRIRLALTK